MAPTFLDVLKDFFPGGFTPGTTLVDLLNQSDLVRELDTVREEIDALVKFETTAVGSSVAVTTGLSIGYVLWLTRGGLLISSLLSSMPAWRLIDPIPVLASLGRTDEDDGEDDSLGSLFGGGAEPEGSEPESESPMDDDDGLQEPDPDRRGVA